MLTAQEAREMADHYYITGYDLEQEIMIAACQGKREYIYRGVLPLYIKDDLETLGYKVLETEEYRNGVTSHYTSIVW